MDLGIWGKSALVCGASKDLGRSCAQALAAEGANLVIVARGAADLEQTATEIARRTSAQVVAVATDITTPEGRAKALAACPNPDILVNKTGGPPPGDFREWSRGDWIAAIDANMLTPIELMKSTVDGMIARKFGRIVNITSGAVKAPITNLGRSGRAGKAPHWHPGAALRHARGIRRVLRLPLQRAGLLHDGKERAARRRQLSRHLLNPRSRAASNSNPIYFNQGASR